MARVPVQAAGGIVLRREQPPLIALVRLRKRDEWVLPKGKFDNGETARAAARREVLEETGHDVTVHEFLGTLVYESGGRSKVVHYWSMEADGRRSRELTSDVRAVDWLPLAAALERLSRGYERAFLENVGPLAVSGLSRRLKGRAPAAKKRRTVVAHEPAAIEPPPKVLPDDLAPSAVLAEGSPVVANHVWIDTPVEPEVARAPVEADHAGVAVAAADDHRRDVASVEPERWSLAQRLRKWLVVRL
jgi:8-oxo-dGTP diphosphatase